MSLLDDLRSAEKGGRELSDRVLLELGWTQTSHVRQDPYDGGDVLCFDWHMPGDKLRFKGHRPDPTRVVDDALSLIAGKWWVLNSGTQTGRSHAIIEHGDEQVDVYAATPALAIAIAAIEARSKE